MSQSIAQESIERLIDKLPDSTAIRNELIATRKNAALLRRLLKIRLEAERCGDSQLQELANHA